MDQNEVKYIVKDIFHHPGDVDQFISAITTSLHDIYVSTSVGETQVKPKVFDTKTTAGRYLSEIKKLARRDWNENSHIHKQYGYKKPQWDIYEYNP